MKTLEDMIKDKIEEVLVLMEANRDTISYDGTSYQLEDGRSVNINVETWSSSSTCW